MWPIHKIYICLGIALITFLHAAIKGEPIVSFYTNVFLAKFSDEKSEVEKQFRWYYNGKMLLDGLLLIFSICLWGTAALVRWKPQDLSLTTYPIYYFLNSICWHAFLIPLHVIAILHSIYVLIMFSENTGLIYTETVTHLMNIFKTLKMDAESGK